MDFYKTLNEGISLAEIKKIQWDLKGEDVQFKPDRVAVRMEDINGKVFELVLHRETMPAWYSQECVILNVVLMAHGLLPDGMWFGWNWDTAKAVNYARAHTENEFISNEQECIRDPWVVPHVRF